MNEKLDQLQAMLAGYVDGTLDDRDHAEVERLLDAEPALRKRVMQMMVDSEALRAMPPQQTPVDLAEQFRARAERDLLLGDESIPIGAGRKFGVPWMAIAAVLLLGAGMAGLAWNVLSDRPASTFETAVRDSADKPTATTSSAGGGETDVAVVSVPPSVEPPTPAIETAVARVAMPGSQARFADATDALTFEAGPLPSDVAGLFGPLLPVSDASAPTAVIVIDGANVASADLQVNSYLLDNEIRPERQAVNPTQFAAAAPDRDAGLVENVSTAEEQAISQARQQTSRSAPIVARLSRKQTADLVKELNRNPMQQRAVVFAVPDADDQQNQHAKRLEPSPTTTPADRPRVTIVDSETPEIESTVGAAIEFDGTIKIPVRPAGSTTEAEEMDRSMKAEIDLPTTAPTSQPTQSEDDLRVVVVVRGGELIEPTTHPTTAPSAAPAADPFGD
jgi:hypothetical protein